MAVAIPTMAIINLLHMQSSYCNCEYIAERLILTGRRVRRRLTTSVAEVLTKSKSSGNLRRSSSTTSGGSSNLMRNYDSAFESSSLVRQLDTS